jgi:predicted phage terminase large subunit-like protein
LEAKAVKRAAVEKARKAKIQAAATVKSKATREINEKEAAERELVKRELAKRHLLAFVKRYENTYLAGWVHKVICEELMQFLQDVVDKKSPRLMITMPPRHGKSMLASQYFPAWALGNHPHLEFINTSYAQSLQMDFSRKIQDLVRSPDFSLLFDGLQITKNNEAVERWGLSDRKGARTGGGVLAAGVGGPITGRGAHVLLIDDPVKNREEAESQTVREGAKSWYSSTAYTRLAPGGGVLVIQTRWHDDDLSGWLLSEMREAEIEMKETGVWPEDADQWRVVDFPAIATHDEKYRHTGDALHADRYPLKALRKIKRTLAPRDWAALFQQNPQVEEGAYFSKKMIRYYTSNPPKFMDIYASGDLAISKKEQADFSVFLVVGVDEQENIYVLEEYRGRGWGTTEIIDTMVEIHRKWKPRRFGLESGHISLTMEDSINARIRKDKLFDLHLEPLKPGKADKELRARAIQGLMSQGKVFWPQGALWVDEFLNELLRFPNGVKDDRVDAAAWIGKMLSLQQYVGTGRPKSDVTKSWKKKLAGYVTGDKGTNNHMAA